MKNLLNKIWLLVDFSKKGVKSTIGKNILSLYVLQISYYILPLITIPYLVRVLGPEKFGLVSFGQSLIAFFVLFVSYGFDLTATRSISVNRDDKEAVNRITSSVWAVKVLLSVTGILILLLLSQFIQKINEILFLLIILYGIVIGQVLFPRWLFQGKEKMGAISIINITVRGISTAGIFLLIRDPKDFLLYAGILSFQGVGTGILGTWYVLKKFGVSLVMPSWINIKDAFIEGGTLFVSNLSMALYNTGNSFILGLLTNYTYVGYYSAAEKMVMALVGLFRPISSAFFPRFSKIASTSKSEVLLWGYRLMYIMGGLGLLTSVFIFLAAPIIVKLVLGEGYEPSIMVLRVLSAIPLLLSVSDVFSIQLMLPFGKDKVYSLIRVIAGPLHIVLAILIVPKLFAAGMSLTFVITEIFIVSSTFLYLWYCQLTPFHYKSENSLYQKTKKVSL
ncbi:MAG: flippase [Thermodesulfobacteriota bacterium]